MVLPSWVKEPYSWSLLAAETGEEVATFVQLDPQLVPAGSYQLKWRQTQHGAAPVILKTVEIVPDKLNNVEITTGLNLAPAEWVPKELRYWSLKDKETGNIVAQFRDNFGPELVPAGDYIIVYRKSEHSSSDSELGEIKIIEGQMNEFPLNTGIKLVPTADTPAPYRIEYIELDSANKPLNKVTQSESFEPMLLKAGRYRVTYQQTQHGSAPIELIDSLDVQAGNLVELEM